MIQLMEAVHHLSNPERKILLTEYRVCFSTAAVHNKQTDRFIKHTHVAKEKIIKHTHLTKER